MQRTAKSKSQNMQFSSTLVILWLLSVEAIGIHLPSPHKAKIPNSPTGLGRNVLSQASPGA